MQASSTPTHKKGNWIRVERRLPEEKGIYPVLKRFAGTDELFESEEFYAGKGKFFTFNVNYWREKDL